MKRIHILALLATLVPALSFAQADLQPAAIVKLTKSEPITVKQLKAEVQKAETQYKRALTLDERRQVLDTMIDERLFLQAADRDKITVTEGELTQQLAPARKTMAQSLGREPTDSEFELAVKNETGMSLAEYKDQMKRTLTLQKFLMSKKRASFEAIKQPSDGEIQQAYDLYQSKLVRPVTIRFSMVAIPFGSDREKAKALADSLVKEIGGDAKRFDDVMVRAQAPASGFQAGDGGYLPKTAEAMKVVGPDFINVAFALKVNEVSRVMEGAKAFQIVKVTESYAQKSLELSDPYQLGSRATVKEYLGNLIYQRTQAQAFETATKELVDEVRTGTPFQIFEKNLAW